MTTPENNDNCSPASSSHYALHVALQTMKERCQNLQKRLSIMEEENLSLRMSQGCIQQGGSSHSDAIAERRVSNQTELEVLREKVSELSRQKVQLMDHISMVAAENRQLWSRLSKITKSNHSVEVVEDTVNRQMNETGLTIGAGGGSQNLIRSKTFTKSAPNPKLREKLAREGVDGFSSSEEANQDLEDVSLLSKCGFIDNGTGVELGFLQQDEDELLMFDLESNPEAKRCTEALIEIQKELLRQQTVLKVALGKLQINKETCQSCRNHTNDVKPVMVDKTVEVGSDLLTQTAPEESSSTEDLPLPDIPKTVAVAPAPRLAGAETEASTLKYVNILQDKIKADALDKMCPMCGRIYVKNVPFDEFQEHVESHFIDENELDLSLDRTYEYISQTVGNF
ncbi:protein spindle-F [Toxorhynchites rutilus septentrionalis]|uniref:protein spindle-F n=1 Tax=Toxorhynchites rutilus septentrionalis TaxID=329112 RepID=UPI00247903CF|nr:protein spindle-F [Toxorhynchites rutilus septentrionalis]